MTQSSIALSLFLKHSSYSMSGCSVCALGGFHTWQRSGVTPAICFEVSTVSGYHMEYQGSNPHPSCSMQGKHMATVLPLWPLFVLNFVCFSFSLLDQYTTLLPQTGKFSVINSTNLTYLFILYYAAEIPQLSDFPTLSVK